MRPFGALAHALDPIIWDDGIAWQRTIEELQATRPCDGNF